MKALGSIKDDLLHKVCFELKSRLTTSIKYDEGNTDTEYRNKLIDWIESTSKIAVDMEIYINK